MIAGAGGASSALLLAQLLQQAQQAGSALQAWTQEKLGELEHVAAERDALRVQLDKLAHTQDGARAAAAARRRARRRAKRAGRRSWCGWALTRSS